jgi:hypothetical protein
VVSLWFEVVSGFCTPRAKDLRLGRPGRRRPGLHNLARGYTNSAGDYTNGVDNDIRNLVMTLRATYDRLGLGLSSHALAKGEPKVSAKDRIGRESANGFAERGEY